MKSVILPYLLTLAALPVHAASNVTNDDAVAQDGARDKEWVLVTKNAQSQYQQHKMADAAAAATQALQLAKHYGSPNERAALNYCQLGNIYRDWGRCSEARANYSRAIAIWNEAGESRGRYLFETVINLAGALCECDDFDSADKLLHKYDAKIRHYQEGPRDQSRILSIHGTVAEARKKYKRAESYYRQSLQLLQSDSKVPAYLVLHEKTNLASVIGKQGRFADSLGESQQLIAIFDREATPSVALIWAVNNAAFSLARLGRLEESEHMFERALLLAKDFYGDDNRTTAKIMLNYASVLRENNQSPAADAMEKRGRETFRRTLVRDNAIVDVANLKQ